MEIYPDNQNLDKLFSSTTFYIDFYQRDYKWKKEPVERLLDDIFYKFNSEYSEKSKLDTSKEIIMQHYSWYYLNTYVTNLSSGKVYIVDGQQRLTTLTLMIIKLYHLAEQYDSNLKSWLENKIAGVSGFDREFWINHEKHNKTLQALFERKIELKRIDTSLGITSENMVKNYELISYWLERMLDDKHKYETFVFYMLYRLVIINLSVEQTEVPMVFEVINDRGVKLKPYEILKGKLLGQIDKIELKEGKYNELWENQVKIINDYYEDEIDVFFVYWLKAKFANSRKESQRFDKDYHREIFKDDLEAILKLKHNPAAVKKFLKNDFKYYTDLYAKMIKYDAKYHEKYQTVYYNRLNEIDFQFLLILSGCKIHDKQEDEKIQVISYEYDRLFSLLQLQGAYDSNSFVELTYNISKEIREADVSTYKSVFDKHLEAEIRTKRNNPSVSSLQYTYFKNSGIYLNLRFKRYFFARIEKFLSDNLNLAMKHSIHDLVSKTGSKTGFHIEHILSYNDANLKLFNNDEEIFEQERNRLGGILILKGRDNISSSNEVFHDKLRSYDNTLYWNETLRKDFYKSKKDVDDFMKSTGLKLKPYDQFGPQELEERQRLLYDIIKIIWK